MRFADEIAIVTGAAGGFGRSIADVLEEQGATVARTDLEGTDIALDVTDRGSVESAVAHVAETMGEPTILVNNAGAADFFPSETLPEERWHKVVDVNLEGTFRCCQVAGARMLTAGRGSIVNIASILADVGMPNHAAYCASKGGVVALTRALAAEWSSRGVRVNAVCPGFASTGMTELAVTLGLLPHDGIMARTPLGRDTEPIDVANVAAFLASSEARDLTGQSLTIDGGYTTWGAPFSAAPRPRRKRG